MLENQMPAVCVCVSVYDPNMSVQKPGRVIYTYGRVAKK